MSALEPGQTLQAYRVVQLVGRGGMGSVYEAEHTETGERRALKVMHAEAAARTGFRRRFLREARASMAVSHPNIVRFFEIFEHDSTPVITMELLTGHSLEHDLVMKGKLNLHETAQVLLPIVSAVGYAHALGIVHRDLKPENIFVQSDGTPKLLDFGIVKLTHTEGAAAITQALTQTGYVLGTPFYMSPEQASGEKKIDHRSDIWSMGIILYRCLSGVLPTESNSFPGVFKKIVVDPIQPLDAASMRLPGEVVGLISRMLGKKPDDRPWDLLEVFSVLSPHAEVSAPIFSTASDDAVFETGTPSGETDPDARTIATASPNLAPGDRPSGGTQLILSPQTAGLAPLPLAAPLAPLPFAAPPASSPTPRSGASAPASSPSSQRSPWSKGNQTSPVDLPKNSRVWMVLILLAAICAAGLVAALIRR